MVFDAIRRKAAPMQSPNLPPSKKSCWRQALVCGTLLFAASAAQQIGITIIRPRQKLAS